MKKTLFLTLALVIVFSLASCATAGVGKNYEIPADSDFTYSSNWEKKTYIDAYQLPTNDKYIVTWATTGLFSNSATNGSECSAKLIINYRGEVEIMVYEYGKYLADSYSTDYTYNYNIRNLNTEAVVAKGSAQLSDRFSIKYGEAADLMNILCKGGQYVITIAGGRYVKSVYVLAFDATGCAAALKSIFPVAAAQ